MEGDYNNVKEDFINRWGDLAVNWGVNKAMGQIQALLLTSPEPICSKTIIEELKLSTGSVSQALRVLLEWGLVHKSPVKGERKDYFIAEKDALKMFRVVIEQRKKRELDPMIKLLEDVKDVEALCPASSDFSLMVEQMLNFSTGADEALNKLIFCQPKWLYNAYMKK